MNAATYIKQPFLTLFRLLPFLADFCRKADTSLILFFFFFGSVSSSNSGSLFAEKKIAKKVLNCSYINCLMLFRLAETSLVFEAGLVSLSTSSLLFILNFFEN